MTKRIDLTPIQCEGDRRSLPQIYKDRQKVFETMLGLPGRKKRMQRDAVIIGRADKRKLSASGDRRALK